LIRLEHCARSRGKTQVRDYFGNRGFPLLVIAEYANAAAGYLVRTATDAAIACIYFDGDAHACSWHRRNDRHLLVDLLGHA